MVNLAKLTALVALHLRPLSYKPTPNPPTPMVNAVENPSKVAESPHAPRHLLWGRSVPPAHYFSSFAAREQKKRKGEARTTSSASVATAATGKLAAELSSVGCAVNPYDAPQIPEQMFPPYDATKANVYRYRQQQAVNLGSWFVHEKWMTPSLFTCAAEPQIAEIDIAKGWGSLDGARAVLERHWDTFITEWDFQYLSSIGINTVRLPIGYWNLGPNFTQNTPFESVGSVYVNSWSRIVHAINLAGERGLGVLIDLHGAVGSQNGEHHSGISDGKAALFENTWYQEKTIEVLVFLVQELGNVNNVVGIQILNEPKYVDGLNDFYTRAIDAIRKVSSTAARFPLYLHDGFDLGRMSQFVSGRTDFVVQDHHSYFVFSDADKAEKASQHTADVRNSIWQSLRDVANKQRRNLIVGEWSCALTPTSMENDGDSTQLRKEFCTQQQDVYTNATAGWSFWSYTKEGCDGDPGWCFKAAVGTALPSNFHSYSLTKTNDNTSFAGHQNARSESNCDPDSTSAGISHRFEAIHSQRVAQSQSQGYIDGLNTANVFAQYRSKLGFIGQFIHDTQPDTQALLRGRADANHADDFLKGLRDGEHAAQAAFICA